MRIDSISIDNFRGIKHLDLTFDSQFTLLVGDNGSGKTSILSALSVALGIWHVSRIVNGAKQWRNIMDHEVREELRMEGDRYRFVPCVDVQITAKGSVAGNPTHSWTRRKRARKSKTVDVWSNEIVAAIQDLVEERDAQAEPLPLLAYYGAGRAWMPSNERAKPDISGDLRGRLEDGYYDCLNERIRMPDLHKWFLLEAAARNKSGEFRPGFETVRLALKKGVAGADDIFYDFDKQELVISFNGNAQPFSNLSDGQRTMAATVADLAIRAVTLNSYLFGNGNGGYAEPQVILNETPGVVLIDEIDVHLHPVWQRSVVQDLMRTFPKVQFICSSHSPQVFGELPPGNILVSDPESGQWHHPSRSLGMDSSRVLDEEMDADSRNQEFRRKLSTLAETIDKEDFPGAEPLLKEVEKTLGEDDPEVTRARTLISFLQDTK